MNKNDYCIRLETPANHAEVENMVRESFWNVYRPGCLEHYVLHCLRNDKDFVPEEVEKFDERFPYKEKLRLPGQLV